MASFSRLVAVATSVVLALHAAPAFAESRPADDDFNGDGYSDLAVAAVDATVDGRTRAGYVAVLYGSADGLKASTKQVFTQNSTGIPDSAETDDQFGSALDSADLDRDGYTDLIVGAGGEDTAAGGANSGLVQVIWGSAQGLSGGSTLITGESMTGAWGGVGNAGSMTAGDVDGDGDADLVFVEKNWKVRAVKGPFGRDATNGGQQLVEELSDPRFLDLASGDVNGDGIDDVVGTLNDGDEYDFRRVQYWQGTANGLAESTVLMDSRGWRLQGGESLDLGDVNGDGYDDIVVGRSVDGYDSDLDTPLALGGRIAVTPGTASGPDSFKTKYLNQDSAGVPGVAERGDGFGSDVSVADVDGDGYEDVSAGVFGEDYDGLSVAGSVVVLRGGAAGLTGTGAKSYSQQTEGVPGAAESGDWFGRTTRLVDANRDGRAELAVGATGENAGAGSVWVFKSASPTGAFTFGAGTLGTVAAKAKLGSGFAY